MMSEENISQAQPIDPADNSGVSEQSQDPQGIDNEPLVTEGMNWFVLRVASNKESSVKQTLLRKIKIEDFSDRINRILVPTEKEKIIKGGKQRVIEKKLYPGYVFVEMKLRSEERRVGQESRAR